MKILREPLLPFLLLAPVGPDRGGAGCSLEQDFADEAGLATAFPDATDPRARGETAVVQLFRSIDAATTPIPSDRVLRAACLSISGRSDGRRS